MSEMFPIPCVCLTCGFYDNCKYRDGVMKLYKDVIGTPFLALSNIICTYYEYSPTTQYREFLYDKENKKC